MYRTLVHINMSILKNSICLLAMFAIASVVLGQSSQGGSHSSQGRPHEDQGRVKRQADQSGPAANGVVVNWTTCDPVATPKYSCQDCNSRLICLPTGAGKVISCPSLYKPYCVDGNCSPIASPECA